MFNQVATIMMSGIIVALIFPMLIMPALGLDKNLWITVMSVLAIIALPLTLLEYFFTKERVTEETASEHNEDIPYLTQVKAVFTNKYLMLIFVYFLIYALARTLEYQSGYYCNYFLGSYNDGITQT